MLTRLILAGLALAAGLALVPAEAADPKVRIATEGAYEPFNYKTPDGQLAGFDVDIAKALCAKAHLDCTIVAQDWDGIIPGLLAKKYDAIVASMSITPERKAKVDFTNKYYQTPARFAAKKGTTLVISAEGLKGKVLGAQRSTIHANYLNGVYGSIADIKLYDTQENANLDLVAGRLDAVLSDEAVEQLGFLSKPEGKDFDFIGPELRDPKYFGEGSGIAVRKGDDKLREAFNKAIAEVRADGTYKTINDKYFPFDIY